MKRFIFPILFSILFSIISCKSNLNINYLEDIKQVTMQSSKEHSVFTIQPGDQLVILVSAKDNDVTKPFNQNYSSGDVSQYSVASTNLPIQAQSSVSGPTYVVSSGHTIDFPELGAINTKDKTTEQLKDEIRDKLTRYIKNPTVSVRLTNFKVSVLGEVNNPGRFNIPDGQSATLLEAIAMAGDLTIYGEREKILVLRNTDGNPEYHTIDISKTDFVNSPYFYIKQNDQIIVPANKTKQNSSSFGPQTALWVSIASVAIGLIAIFVR